MLSNSLANAHRKAARLPDWRVHQISWFIKYVGLYAGDLNEAYRTNRLDSLAQAMRNLMELSVWVKFCESSEEEGKRFFDDGLRDFREMVEVLQKMYTKENKVPQKRLEEILSAVKSAAPKFNITDVDAGYLRVSDAVVKIGKKDIHSAFYKIASKFAHPTALLLLMQEPFASMQDSIYEIGSKLADECLRALEKTVMNTYGDIEIRR
jgi:hypothetical protein